MRIVRLFCHYEACFQLILACKASSFMHEACVEYTWTLCIEGSAENERAKTKHAKEIFIELKVCA